MPFANSLALEAGGELFALLEQLRGSVLYM